MAEDVFPYCGHPRTPRNTYTSPKGLTVCRKCKNARTSEAYGREIKTPWIAKFYEAR